MNKEKFAAVFPVICSSLAEKIIDNHVLTAEELPGKLYRSQLYEKLENEETKVWHYSTDKLFDLFKEELNTGKTTFPDV